MNHARTDSPRNCPLALSADATKAKGRRLGGNTPPGIRTAAPGGTRRRHRRPGSCTTESPAGNPTRETLPNGGVLVRYPDLPAIDSIGPEVADVQIDLRFGSREGDDPNLIFGNIRGVQAASDGTIYVLDHQATEVRVFGPDGGYLRTIARRGEGPGEIVEANGILLSGDTLLWIHDYGQNKIEGIDPAGEEVRRFTKPVFGYGYMWDGAFDRQGRYWQESPPLRRRWGPGRGAGPVFRNRAGHTTDSMTCPRRRSTRSTWARRPTGHTCRPGVSGYQIPFDASDIDAVNPSGGLWLANTGTYRLTHIGVGGDTLTVIEASVPRIPVTSEDRSSYVARWAESQPEERPALEAVAALMPDFKPVFAGLLVDDEDRLWVQRTTPADVPPFFDLFSQDGDYLGSVRLAFRPGYRHWIQHGAIYTWVVDEVGVQYVARAPLP